VVRDGKQLQDQSMQWSNDEELVRLDHGLHLVGQLQRNPAELPMVSLRSDDFRRVPPAKLRLGRHLQDLRARALQR
jgi:hypothetical protein